MNSGGVCRNFLTPNRDEILWLLPVNLDKLATLKTFYKISQCCKEINEHMAKIWINLIKSLSFLGMFAAAAWFFVMPDFAAVLTGILSLSAFMFTFLPVATDQQI